MALQASGPAAEHPRTGTQHPTVIRRLSSSMKDHHRELAVEVIRPVVLAVVAGLLILVVLPAALGVQAATIR